MNNWTYAARLESFPDVPEKVFEKGNPSYTTFDKIDRMAQAKGVTHIEPNYRTIFMKIPQRKSAITPRDMAWM